MAYAGGETVFSVGWPSLVVETQSEEFNGLYTLYHSTSNTQRWAFIHHNTDQASGTERGGQTDWDVR